MRASRRLIVLGAVLLCGCQKKVADESGTASSAAAIPSISVPAQPPPPPSLLRRRAWSTSLPVPS